MSLKTPNDTSVAADLLWYDGSDDTAFSLNGSNIIQCLDKAVRGVHISQATDEQRPTRVATGISNDASAKLLSGSITGIADGTVNSYRIYIIASAAEGRGSIPGQQDNYTPYWVYRAENNNALSVRGNTSSPSGPVAPIISISAGVLCVTEVRTDLSPMLISRATSIGIGEKACYVIDRTPSLIRSSVNFETFVNGLNPPVDNLSWTSIDLPGEFGGYYFNGTVFEGIVVFGTPSTDDHELLEGIIAWRHDLVASLRADHPYKSIAPILAVLLTLDQPVGLALELLLNQPVRDLPVLMMTLNQWVGDLRRVTLGLDQPVSDCPAVRLSLDQPVTMPAQPTLTLDQPVVLADHPVTLSLDQPVVLSANNGSVTLSLDQPVALVSDEIIRQLVTVSVTVGGRAIDFDYLRVGADDNDGFMSATIRFPDPAQYVPMRVGDEVVIVETVDGLFAETTVLQIEALANPEETGSADHEIVAVSPTVVLDEEQLTEDLGPGIAKDISIALAARYGKTLAWQGVENWPFLAGELTADNESAFAVLVREAQASGAFVQSQPDGVTLRLAPEYVVDVAKWPTCATDLELNDQDHIFSIDESQDKRDGCNAFIISGQSSAAGNYRLDDFEISATVKELKGYIVPWSSRAGVYLDHKGGDWVTIDYLGEHEEIVTDVDVVVESGLGRLSLPCYGLVSWRYKEDGLGAVEIDNEDGSIKTEQVGDALLDIRYITRYRKWRGTDPKAESVLYFLDRV